jgi:acyl phosphate:glycerol-3-phosphate acyltransferase
VDIVFTILLAITAFIIGAIPFSVIIGRKALKKDIRQYGDHNPGAANVFRAGGQKSGLAAVMLDIVKGIPAVFVSHAIFGLPDASSIFIALCAILGHAYSPFLHWHGGKAVAVTFGAMIGLPHYETLFAFIVFVLIGFFFIEIDAWKIIFGAAGTLIFLLASKGAAWDTLFMLLVLGILTIKHFEALHTLPHFRGLLFRWFQAIRHNALFIL